MQNRAFINRKTHFQVHLRSYTNILLLSYNECSPSYFVFSGGQGRKSACGSGYQSEGCRARNRHGHAAPGDSSHVAQAGTGGSGDPWQEVWGIPGSLGRASKGYGWHVLHLLCLNTFLFGQFVMQMSLAKEVQVGIAKVTVSMLYQNILQKIMCFKTCWMLQL